MSKLKRSDRIYKEIESFEDYELTNCIAYEMAIRNDEIKENINKWKQIDEGLIGGKTNIIGDMEDFLYDKKLMSYGFNFLNLHYFNKKHDKNKFFSNRYEMFGLSITYNENGEQKIFDDYTKKEQLMFAETILKAQFKRPLLILEDAKKAKVELNLSLPKNELIAYISKIKDEYDKDNSIIKTPLELLGEEFKEADTLVCNDKGKCFDSRAILTKQQKMADMFYIYDALKEGFTQRKIQNEIYNYYADNGIETKTMDAKTLKRYKEIAVDYIDNMRYKELVTGIKLENLEK